jgi:hypothetical protein
MSQASPVQLQTISDEELEKYSMFEHTPVHRALEILGIGSAGALVFYLLWRCFWGDAATLSEINSSRLWVLMTSVFAGYLLADFASGVVHFTFDRFFSLETPLLGKTFVHPFRTHHVDAQDITRHGFVETNGNNSLATIPVILPLALLPWNTESLWQIFIVHTIVWGAIGTFGTNQFHKWAHEEKVPMWLDWMQRWHLVLPREHHNVHHTFPYTTHYCITTGWLNPLMSKLKIWSLLEWIGTRIFGLALYTEKIDWSKYHVVVKHKKAS